MEARNSKIKKIIKQLASDYPYYANATMAIAVASKTERLKAKNKPVQVFTLHAQDEFTQFVANLELNKPLIPENTRFQFVYHFGGHWTAGDIRIKNGKLEFFLLDGIHAQLNYETLIGAIKEQSPDALVTYCSGQTFQRVELLNCGTFALDHAFQMAKIPNLHEKVAELNKRPEVDLFSNQFDDYLFNNTLKTISVADFPPEFGPLLRNMQSLSTLRTLFFNKGYIANDKKISLDDYVTARSRVGENPEMKGEEKDWKNYSVVDKRRTIKTKATTFFRGLDETKINYLLDNRSGGNVKFFAMQAVPASVDKDRLPDDMRACFY